jgi:hypothetical protein
VAAVQVVTVMPAFLVQQTQAAAAAVLAMAY